MSEKFMPSDKVIKLHLSYTAPSGAATMFSGFSKGLREARESSGRNLDTGDKLSNRSHASWLAFIGYMSLLDQIGSCFKPKGTPIEQGSAITKALKYFSALDEKSIDALYALRNAFTHDFSLYNINTSKPQFTQCFRVYGKCTGDVVELPKIAWNGDYNNRNNDNYTLINLEAFGDLVEDLCCKLFSLANSSDLEVTLQGGSDELLQRYSFYTQT